MKKVPGYILITIGAIIIALSYPSIRAILNVDFKIINDIYLMTIGLVLIVIGAFIGFKNSGEKYSEVPIYEGQGKKRKIVGYQRHGK